MFKARICGWIGLLPLFMLSLPVQAELRCVANTVDIEPFFSAATAEDKQQVEQAINSSVNLVPFGLSASDWKVHRGDLVVEGNIESNQKLIVLGNLTVKGNISTFSLSNPWVILGNVTATNIVTDSPLLITGSINASGLVFIDSYYDNPSSIKGSINARGIFINDIIAPVVASSTNSEFMVRASDKNDTENVKKALMIINPDAYYWGLINDEDALKEIFKRSNIRMAGNVCNQMKKEALFRPKPSPELVQELQMLDEGNVAAFEGRDIATFDLAIMRTLPRLKGISANLRKQLINSNDEQTIESMARYMPDNEILELTDQQLGYQPVVLGLLDREPLSVEIMTRMSRLPDGVGPLNLALRENLPLDIVMTLAKRDWDMIIQELYKDAWLLPESIIDGYIRSDDSSIRQVGAGGQLTYNQAMQLANDSSNNVVTSLAFKLAEMKHHGQLLRMTPQESDKVAAYLYQKFENDDDLIRVLFLALPDNLQFNFVKRMEKKSPAYFCCRDMQVIHSDAALQRLLTRFNDPEGWSNLAKNQYLSTSMKQKIWQRALSHRKNNPKADSAAYETSADMILSELISHGEVDDQMLLNATALIRLEDWDFLESALVSWDNLPAVVLKELQQNTPRNDIWAKFFLRQENSSRAQVDEALRVYYALDPDALAQLDVLAKQPDRIWWSTLAKSNLTFFKFGALNNRHTPPAVLAAEIDPEWWIVAMNNPRFPVDVLKARLKRDPLLALWHRLRGLFFINSYVKGRYLTHDRQRVASFNNDPLITRAIAVNILLDLYKTSERIIRDAAAITLPTQLLISGDDYVVHRQPQIDFYQRLRSPLKELHLLPGFYHDTLGEENRAQAFEKMQSFISRLYANKSQKFDYQHEDRTGPSADRWRLLSGGPVPLSPVDLAYRFMRKAMKLFGAHSAGLHLGMSTGFDSGSSLDYVYQNQPQGSNAFGRLIDKIYLNSVGWRGIRQRKTHLQILIKQAVADLHAKGLAVRVVDIAAGHGRYVLNALANEPAVSDILLRDYSELNVAQGQAMIAQRGMSGRVRFEQGDAFNPEELSALTPRPTLAIVSGLYELFPENEQVKNSLAGLANAIEPGGILIYTGQPWHPQLEMIAGVLTSHKDGKPWVMRVRSQGEMDSLVRDAGFDKCTQRIDEWGIFTVSMAVRRDN